MKVLYSAGVVTAHRAYDKGCGLYGFFNGLLWMLLGLNIYWLVVRRSSGSAPLLLSFDLVHSSTASSSLPGNGEQSARRARGRRRRRTDVSAVKGERETIDLCLSLSSFEVRPQ